MDDVSEDPNGIIVAHILKVYIIDLQDNKQNFPSKSTAVKKSIAESDSDGEAEVIPPPGQEGRGDPPGHKKAKVTPPGPGTRRQR